MSERFPGKDIYPNLFKPIRIGNIKLKNRIIAAPTSPSMITTEGLFTPEMAAYLEEKALGGCAVVTYGEAIPHAKTGKSHNKQLQLDAFGVRQGLTESTRMIHNAGGLSNIQLSHGGMYGGLASVGGDIGTCDVAYGPSEMDMPAGHVYEMPKELIYEIIESYKILAEGLADYLGDGYEIVVQSLGNLEHSVVKILNGNHTGRKEGSPITDLGLTMVKNMSEHGSPKHMTYFNKTSKCEPLKSCSIAITGENGNVIGRHKGVIFYTIGQRRGIGTGFGKPMYVIGKNADNNTVTLGGNELLFTDTLYADNLNWIAFEYPESEFKCKAKTRYRQTEQPCTVYPQGRNTVRVVFDEKIRAVTPGQHVVFYDGDIVLGGGTIIK